MKVIIVDDELYICKLVQHLIDWQGLGLTLLGIFQNYEDTLQQFLTEPADILICDIEMPGKNGIEIIKEIKEKYPKCRSIVISGFRKFDYVHKAMQYGAANYLLKPIDEEELNRVLKEVVFKTREQYSRESIIAERNMRMGIYNAIRLGVIENDVMSVNLKYHYQFQEGRFNTLKVSFADMDPASEQMQEAVRQFEDVVRKELSNVCYDMEVYHETIVSEILFINYDAENEKRMVFILEQVLNDALSKVGSISEGRCIIGVGKSVSEISRVRDCMHSAEKAWCRCFYTERKEIFYAKNEEADDNQEKYTLSYEQKKEFRSMIEAIRPDDFVRCLREMFRDNAPLFRQKPELVLQFSTQLMEFFQLTMDELNAPVQDRNAFENKFEVLFFNSGSISRLTDQLGRLFSQEVIENLAEKQKNTLIYVQQAKNYIESNYAQAITLEKIAQQLHINPVYLSVIFKSEVGMNYSKYLTHVRMQKAKELLKRPELNISQVASAVGYDSTYYFTTLFKKETAIKPSEYRRLYQQDIMYGE